MQQYRKLRRTVSDSCTLLKKVDRDRIRLTETPDGVPSTLRFGRSASGGVRSRFLGRPSKAQLPLLLNKSKMVMAVKTAVRSPDDSICCQCGTILGINRSTQVEDFMQQLLSVNSIFQCVLPLTDAR